MRYWRIILATKSAMEEVPFRKVIIEQVSVSYNRLDIFFFARGLVPNL